MKKEFPPKSKTSSAAFHIPMNEEGRKLLDEMKRYKNVGVRLNARGRGPRKGVKGAEQSHVPLAVATWAAVYISRENHHYNQRMQDELYEMARTIRDHRENETYLLRSSNELATQLAYYYKHPIVRFFRWFGLFKRNK